MKIHSFKLEIFIFSLIFCFFVLPSIFISSQNSSTVDIISSHNIYISFSYFIFAFCLFLFYKDKNNYPIKISYKIILKFILITFITTLLLFIISTFVNFLSSLFIEIIKQPVLYKLKNFSFYLNATLIFYFSSFFEEILYRFYLPDILFNLLNFNRNKKEIPFKIVSEILSCLLFSFGHLYLGIFSVLNALLAHCLLRFIFYKYNNILITSTAHFVYNIISFILL